MIIKDIQEWQIFYGDAIEEFTLFSRYANGINYSNPVELEIADGDKNLHHIEPHPLKFFDDRNIS